MALVISAIVQTFKAIGSKTLVMPARSARHLVSASLNRLMNPFQFCDQYREFYGGKLSRDPPENSLVGLH